MGVNKLVNTEGNRLNLIEFLQWNDRHGCYTDENCDLEGISRLSYNQVIKFFFGVIN